MRYEHRVNAINALPHRGARWILRVHDETRTCPRDHRPGDDPASASNRDAMSMANGDSTDDPDRDAPYRKRRRIAWARLLRQVFAIDVLQCSCGGERKVIAALTRNDSPNALRRYLEHVGEPADPPPTAPARAPPQMDFGLIPTSKQLRDAALLPDFMKFGNNAAVYQRTLENALRNERKSLFLLGPRQTGKSTLLRAALPDASFIDLMEPQTHRQLLAHPEKLRDRLPLPGTVVIDEIQRIPALLDVVQIVLSSSEEWRFVLTGSSARKLRAQGVNLLGGRATRRRLHPITSLELATDVSSRHSVSDLISRGGLPPVLAAQHPRNELADYTELYLREEIQAEAAVRNLSGFARFLSVAAACNGEQVIFTNVSRDAEVPARTVREYFHLLEDTLVGELLPGFTATSKRKAMSSAKFYFFDVGIANVLAGRVGVERDDQAWGRALEHFVYTELRAWTSYRMPTARLSYWRSASRLEVDFVLEVDPPWEFPFRQGPSPSSPMDSPWAFLQGHGDGSQAVGIEVKATRQVGPTDLKGLRALREEVPHLRCIVVAAEPAPRVVDGIEIVPLPNFLSLLWQDGLSAGTPFPPAVS